MHHHPVVPFEQTNVYRLVPENLFLLPSTLPAHNMPATTPPPIDMRNDAPALQLTEAELDIVKIWTQLYKEADRTERYNMLKTKILPRLYPLNKELTTNAWKLWKSVSTMLKLLPPIQVNIQSLGMSSK